MNKHKSLSSIRSYREKKIRLVQTAERAVPTGTHSTLQSSSAITVQVKLDDQRRTQKPRSAYHESN